MADIPLPDDDIENDRGNGAYMYGHTDTQMHAYAAAVSAADNAALRAELADINSALMAESLSAEGLADAQAYLMTEVKGLRERVKVLEDALRKVIVQNEHDMLLTGEELRAARAALGDAP